MVSRHTKNPRKPGFTLIELLVVVAIIALLISILLPSLNRAKQQARQVLCLSNLRSQGEAAYLYAEDNGGNLPRGVVGIRKMQTYPGYHSYSTCLLKYLGWTGELGVQARLQRTVDVSDDPSKLWNHDSPFGPDWWRVLNAVLRNVEILQCPDYPELEEVWPGQDNKGNPVDYVSSAMPIPYTEKNLIVDGSGTVWDPDGGTSGVDGDRVDYEEATKLERFPPGTSPAALIYAADGNTSLPWKKDGSINFAGGPLFHHFFVAQHLPFAGLPRIADDQRHPGGINALFFDGHAQTMDLHDVDKGYPNPLDQRLRWFTVMPDFYFE